MNFEQAPGHQVYASTTECKWWCECGRVFYATELLDLEPEYRRHC